MFESLYRYLIKYRQVDLPGIGAIVIQVQPVVAVFVNRSFLPPVYSFVFQQARETSSKKLFSWLGGVFNITEREAVIRLNDFVFDLKKQLEAGRIVTWSGVGSLQKGNGGEIRFHAFKKELDFPGAVVAEKLIRGNAEHTMLVGELEKTSTEMTEFLLNPPAEEKRSYWWIGPLAIIVLAFMFLGWFFSEHGIKTSSTGNSQIISPAEAPPGFYFTP